MGAAEQYISKVNSLIEGNSIGEALTQIAAAFPEKVVFSTSFSSEDQVIGHTIFTNKLGVKVFTLDTGRLFAETYSTWSRTIELYRQKITPYYPDANALEKFVQQKGPNSFYESVDNRKKCCHIRKVEPLKRALKGNTVWITGIRAEHSNGRSDMPMVEYDEQNDIVKYHPLLHWTTKEVNDFIIANQVPYNPLHDKGFISIGCMPCTRAIQPCDDFRAGRWWWEDSSKKECGLHSHSK